MFSNFFKKESKMKEALPETLPMEQVVVKNNDNLVWMVTEDDIRTHAYFLWESSDKVGSSEDYWYKAEQELLGEALNQIA